MRHSPIVSNNGTDKGILEYADVNKPAGRSIVYRCATGMLQRIEKLDLNAVSRAKEHDLPTSTDLVLESRIPA